MCVINTNIIVFYWTRGSEGSTSALTRQPKRWLSHISPSSLPPLFRRRPASLPHRQRRTASQDAVWRHVPRLFNCTFVYVCTLWPAEPRSLCSASRRSALPAHTSTELTLWLYEGVSCDEPIRFSSRSAHANSGRESWSSRSTTSRQPPL